MLKTAKIISTGKYLPEKVLSNLDLEKMVETSDEWITSRTGMKERRLASQDEAASDMGYIAAKNALKKANLKPEEIDAIIFSTLTPDYMFPASACLLQDKLKCTNAFALDIQAACTGFLYALFIAKSFIQSGQCKNLLVVASEKLSSIVDYEDRNTCVLFGDGAAAAVVSSEGEGLEISHVNLGADGAQSELLIMPGGGSKNPATKKSIEDKMHFIKMQGKDVFKHAVRKMEQAAKDCIETAGLSEQDIHWLIPHQANIRIIEAIAKRFKIAQDHVFLTIHKYGNTSASSVAIALDELLEEKQVSKGENLLLVAFGAGFTWGAALLKA